MTAPTPREDAAEGLTAELLGVEASLTQAVERLERAIHLAAALTRREPLDVGRLGAFAKLLEAEWYNGNMTEAAYDRLNADLTGIEGAG